MEMYLRGSEYNSFLTCRKQWLFQWVERIEPKRPDGKLFFGTVMHKWLEHYYKSNCDKVLVDNITKGFILASDLSAMEQTEIDDLHELLKGVTEYYHETYGESDKQFNVLGTEVEFLVKLEEDIFMTGTIDLVYEVDGKIRFADHKTASSIQMYIEKSYMDRQISRYWWALKMIASGIGRIKDENGNWKVWQELQGKEISGFDYNIIAKDFPKEPKVLKSGKLSTDKSQKTTREKYIKKIQELGLDGYEYVDMLDYLRDKPNQWLHRIDVKRTDAELESAAWEFMYTAGDIHDVKLMITEKPHLVDTMTYRNIGHHCHNMCSYRSICQTAIEGGNVSLVKNLGFRKKESVE